MTSRSTSRPKRRVLVVDDDETIRRTYTRILRATCEVVDVSSGEAGLARLEAGERFDAVLCDYQLGRGMDGIAFITRARDLDPEQWRRIALVAGSTPSAADARTLPRPPLAKPLEASELRAVVDALAAPKGDDR